jgi:hypothetical protein
MLIRYLIIGAFSLTASSIMLYQGVEIFNAFLDFFRQK